MIMATDSNDNQIVAMNEQLLLAGLHQHELAQEAAESRELYRTLVDNFPNGIVLLFDAQMRHTVAGGDALDALGFSKAALEGRTIWDMFSQALCDQIGPLYASALRGESRTAEIWFGARAHEVRTLPVRDARGAVIGGMAVTHDNTERVLAEQEQARQLAELELRAKRQDLVSAVAQAVLRSDDPVAIQAIATRSLGEFLGADRCYFCFHDAYEGTFTINTEWRRARLKGMVGVYRTADYADLMAEYRRAQHVVVIDDIRADPRFARTRKTLEGLRVGAAIRVPMFERNEIVAALCVSMVEKPRMWSPEEIDLVQTIAAQTKVSIDDVRKLHHERKIAGELQDALLPELPPSSPGLAVKKYYASAWQESTVGGDFFDVYALDSNRTVLCVGDVSGKGLAAATQVGALRHMLRAALYLDHTLEQAVTDLNGMLTSRELLAGFATLWVSIYDKSTRTLSYINCGQEPGLVKRAATGEIERCAPTGPIVGSFLDAEYLESRISLAPGDALAIFTDGLTEVGPSRHDQLGIDGVVRLLSRAPAAAPLDDSTEQMAEALVDHLASSIVEFAEDGPRDDMCLLVAVAS